MNNRDGSAPVNILKGAAAKIRSQINIVTMDQWVQWIRSALSASQSIFE